MAVNNIYNYNNLNTNYSNTNVKATSKPDASNAISSLTGKSNTDSVDIKSYLSEKLKSLTSPDLSGYLNYNSNGNLNLANILNTDGNNSDSNNDLISSITGGANNTLSLADLLNSDGSNSSDDLLSDITNGTNSSSSLADLLGGSGSTSGSSSDGLESIFNEIANDSLSKINDLINSALQARTANSQSADADKSEDASKVNSSKSGKV